MQAADYLNQFPNVTLISRQPLCETPYLAGVFAELATYDFFEKLHFVITDHLSRPPAVDAQTIIFYLSNEDGRLPEYINDAGLVFTPYPPKNNHPKARTIPLGYNGHISALPIKPLAKRSWHIAFSGRKIQRRSQALNNLDLLAEEQPESVYLQKTKQFGEGLPPDEYAHLLNEAKIVIAPEGNFSNITFRLFEALRQGAIPATPSLPAEWYLNDFPGWVLNNWANLSDVLYQLLNQPEKWQEWQDTILDFYRKQCAEPAVAQKISQEIRQYYSF